MQPTTGKLLRLHFSERDRYRNRPLYEAIVERCRELGMAGATVLRGIEGFGETTEIHKQRLVGSDRPVIDVIVDSSEKIAGLLMAVEPMIDKAMIALSDVQILRKVSSLP